MLYIYRDGYCCESQRGIRSSAYGQICCFTGVCITRDAVQEITFVSNEWECHVNFIITFLRGEKSYAPLTQNIFVKTWAPGDRLT